jgi:uridine kinase
MALYEKRFRDLMDLKIFVMTDDDIRLSRRIRRDIAERGRTIEDVLRQYNKFVKASYDEFIKPTMKYADIIIPHGRSNTVAIEFVIENLKIKVPKGNLDEDFSQQTMQKQKSIAEQIKKGDNLINEE